MKISILQAALIAVFGGGFTGFGIGALVGNPSFGTGIGFGIGVLAAIIYGIANRNNPA